MYELINLTENTYYIQSPAKIGLCKVSEDEVVLIDSGSDKEAGRKVRMILDAKGWRLRAIYNTHSNADHIGGNAYLARQTGCRIYAQGVERDFTRHPILEPAFLYGGYPPAELRHKFLLAEESDAEELTPSALPCGFSLIPLPGHFFHMVGIRTPDDVVFLADCLSSAETLLKYGVGFIYDVAAYLETLERVKTLRAKYFVPAHAAVTEDIAPLADLNVEKVREIAARIVSIVEDPLPFEEILARLFRSYSLSMNFEQYALVGSTLRSYLSFLKEKGEVVATFQGEHLLWQKA